MTSIMTDLLKIKGRVIFVMILIVSADPLPPISIPKTIHFYMVFAHASFLLVLISTFLDRYTALWA